VYYGQKFVAARGGFEVGSCVNNAFRLLLSLSCVSFFLVDRRYTQCIYI